MKALLQRVSQAQVEVAGQVVGRIGRGLLVYVGVAPLDDAASAEKLAHKVAHLRIFEDDQGKLNRSVLEVGGQVLAISNFTLLADTRKGRRPSFDTAAGGPAAEPLYEAFVAALANAGCTVARGVFGADMAITSTAAGPINVLVDAAPADPPRPEAP